MARGGERDGGSLGGMQKERETRDCKGSAREREMVGAWEGYRKRTKTRDS